MRTDKELIQVAIDYFYRFNKIYNFSGLCAYFLKLQNDLIISGPEHYRLRILIYKYIQKPGKFYDNLLNFYRPYYASYDYNGWFWKPGLLKPRLRYLKYLLKTV